MVADGAVWANLVVISAPSLALSDGIVDAHEPVLLQAFRPELAVEGVDERIVCRLVKPAKSKGRRGKMPEVEVARDELATFADPVTTRGTSPAGLPLMPQPCPRRAGRSGRSGRSR